MRRRGWRRYGRTAPVIIKADRVIVPSGRDEEPPRGRQPSIVDLIYGALGGMFILRLIDLGKVVLQ